MYRHLMVPLDGSVFAEHALPLAVGLAGRSGATLHLVQVHSPVIPAYGGSEILTDIELDALVREGQRSYLGGVAERLTRAAPVRVTTSLLSGPIAGALRDEALATGTDLVVMTTHGRSPLGRLWLGSVSDQMVRHSPAPLLLVRPRESAPDLAAMPAWQRVLIPLDGSELAEQALGPATELGRLMGADYTLVRVLDPDTVPDPVATDGPNGPLVCLSEEARNYLGQVAGHLRAERLRVQTRVVLGPPAAAIIEECAAEAADVIAMQTHGRGGLGRLWRGSVADELLRASPVPMLIYHWQAARPAEEHAEQPADRAPEPAAVSGCQV
jgi:nucleotide-binding universal stress UspA family protein